MSDSYIHYRFNIAFTQVEGVTPDYTIQDMSGYIRYNQTTKTVEKVGNSQVTSDDGSVTDQLYAKESTVGQVVSDNGLWSDNTKILAFSTTPDKSPNSNYTPITPVPNFYFGTLILAASFITIYKNDAPTTNIASNWILTTLINNTIKLEFTQGVDPALIEIVGYTYTMTFTQVSNLNPDPPNCFIENSKILSNLNGKIDYFPIQMLRNGDLVNTYLHGYKKIIFIGKNKTQNVPSVWNRCICEMKSNDGFDNLKVTGAHSVLVDKLSETESKIQSDLYGTIDRKLDGKYFLTAWASDNFEVIQDDKIYTYYHLVLENDGDVEKRYGIWANGILTESQSEKHFLSKKYQILA
jgi:hypothetical protein